MNQVKNIALVIIFQFPIFWSALYSQDKKEVKGILIDQTTLKPVSFAHISLKGSNKGTASNENGEFSLEVDNTRDTIKITHILYADEELKLNKIDETLKIYLNPASRILDEVIIQDGNKIKSILRNAYLRITRTNDIYSYGKLFYRMVTKENSQPVEIQEILFNIKSNSSRVISSQVQQGRYAIKDNQFLEFNNFSIFTKAITIVSADTSSGGLLPPDISNSVFDYSIEERYKVDSNTIIKISFINSSKSESGYFLINEDNYSIFKVSYSTNNMSPKTSSKKYEVRDNRVNFELSFKPSFSNDSLMIFDYITVSNTFDVYKDSELVSNISVKSVGFFHEMSLENTDKINFKIYDSRSAKKEDRKSLDKKVYDKDYWLKNPVFKRTKAEEEIIEFFDKSNAWEEN